MEQINDFKISSFILHSYHHFLNGNNESIEKIGTESLKIPRFNEKDLIDLCDSAILTLKQINKTIIYIPSPSIVIGDLHGNLHDLIRFINSIIDIFSNRVLFLGDYVDRGQFQLETITILLALRIEYPDHIFLIRGNHEFSSVNTYGGFKEEILKSGYTENLFNKINETFQWFPIAAVINDHIFCVHGGLSPLFHEIKQIETEFTLPIKNIYTNSTNQSKKKGKLPDSSGSRVANYNLRSSLTNVSANLNTNGPLLQTSRNEFKAVGLNVKFPGEPNMTSNSNTKSHSPKFLPLCKKSNYDLSMNKKLPPLGTKSPLPSLSEVKPSISPSTNLNSELENSIANFPSTNSNPQPQNSAKAASPVPAQQNSNQQPNMNSNQTSQNANSNQPPKLNTSQNLQNKNVVHASAIPQTKSTPKDMSVLYISSGQLELVAKYKELELNTNDSKNNTELLTDLMWSDPTNSCELFLPSNRGSGCYFGFVTTNHFLKKNRMKMIVRGHELVKTGIKTNHEKKVVTIYSSSSVQQGGVAGCAIFDADDNYTEFRLVPINIVQRNDAMFYTPTAKQKSNNKPLKLNSFSRSQAKFGNVKKLRRNMIESHPQATNSSPNYNDKMMTDICTIKEEEE